MASAGPVPDVTIVDYGVGNVGALLNMFEYLGFECCSTADPGELERARRLVLPGVGAFDYALGRLEESRLLGVLDRLVIGERKPVLGVCLGMQLLGRTSEEGSRAGLGWIPGRTVRLAPPPARSLKVPHIGWSDVVPTGRGDLFPLESGAVRERFYFVHSYHFVCDSQAHVAATAMYGHEFCCAISAGNVHGVQFHPEKSHKFGMRVLRSFATLPA